MAMRWRLNLLGLPDETAFSLGSSLSRERGLVLLGAVAAAAAVTAVGGIVGWIGLLVPHFARRAYGADSRIAVPASLLIGGISPSSATTLRAPCSPGRSHSES